MMEANLNERHPILTDDVSQCEQTEKADLNWREMLIYCMKNKKQNKTVKILKENSLSFDKCVFWNFYLMFVLFYGIYIQR